MFKDQFIFGQKIVEIVVKMDCLLDEKKKEIQTLELNCSMLNESINTLGHSLALARLGLDDKNDLLDDIIIIEDEVELVEEVEQEAEKSVEAETETDTEVEKEHEGEFNAGTEINAQVENATEMVFEMEDEKVVITEIETEIETDIEDREKFELMENPENESNMPMEPRNMKFEKNEDGKYKCPHDFCLYTSSYSSYIKRHIRRHTDERLLEKRIFKCPYTNICSFTATHKQNMIRHIRVHTGEKPYSCQYCTKRFSQKHHRNQHQLAHEKSNSVRCKSYGKLFKSTDIENHLQRCGKRKNALKRKRPEVEDESGAYSKFASFIV